AASSEPKRSESSTAGWTALTTTGAPSAPTPTTRPMRRSAVRRWACIGAVASDTLEDPRRALPGTHAHRHHAVLQVVAAQRMHDRRAADRAGRAQRVAERDRAAHRVDLGLIEPDRVDHRERLRRER